MADVYSHAEKIYRDRIEQAGLTQKAFQANIYKPTVAENRKIKRIWRSSLRAAEKAAK